MRILVCSKGFYFVDLERVRSFLEVLILAVSGQQLYWRPVQWSSAVWCLGLKMRIENQNV
jgi:hypothetical protein